MKTEFESIENFEDWYQNRRIDADGTTRGYQLSQCANRRIRLFKQYKTEHESRIKGYEKYEMQAAAEFASKKPDLPNISSGENAGFVRRIARNTVQHTPNVNIINEFDDDSIQGIYAKWILKSKIIGDDEYSNAMQQNLHTTVRRGFTYGFDCVIPVLLQNELGQWYMQYDSIYYQDVFPEPGAKDIRRATDVYVRRYLTRGEVHSLIKNQVPGWDLVALKSLLRTAPSVRERTNYEDRKAGNNPEAYEVITWYSNTGEPFLWFDARQGMLLRIEVNKHPLKKHPVFFFVPERDDQQPLGKSLLSLTFGRQEFQDLFLNGSMKMWMRNINPPIIGYGVVNAIPNLGPGKYTQISNPNAKLEAFEINPQSLMMFNQIAQGNAAKMVELTGAADSQAAAQSAGGLMSQTPSGVEAQQELVDTTTAGYQKAVEAFFSQYCSYALTIYFQELKGFKKIKPSADARRYMVDAGLDIEAFNEKGEIELDHSSLAVLYNVQCIPGSLIELEDEKQIRILQALFVALSQALPAISASGDQVALKQATAAFQYIVQKQIELAGSAHSHEIKRIFTGEQTPEEADRTGKIEQALGGAYMQLTQVAEVQTQAIAQMQEQIAALTEATSALLQQPRPAAPPEQPALAPTGPAQAPAGPLP